MKKILGSIFKADRDYQLIESGDVIAVGVSGGKDSMVLLAALNTYRKMAYRISKKEFRVVGIHIEMGFEKMDFSEVRAYCKREGFEYHDVPSKLFDILKLHPKNGKIQCSLCSKLKKGAVVKAAKELGCNKVAFAHHGDDAIETLLMNAIFGGRLATFDAKMHLSDQDITFIRPLVYVYEEQIEKTCVSLALPVVASTCPNEKVTERQRSKELLKQLYTLYPGAHENFLKMLHNPKQVSLWNPLESEEEE